MFDTIKGYTILTDEQKKIFTVTFDRHMKARGTKLQEKYVLENLKEIKWDAAEDCLKVIYKNGDWWHYDAEHEWY